MFACTEEAIEPKEFFAPQLYAFNAKKRNKELISLRSSGKFEGEVLISVSPRRLNVINANSSEELSRLMKRFAGIRRDADWVLWFDGRPLHTLDTAVLARNFMFLDKDSLMFLPENRFDQGALYDKKRQSMMSRLAIHEEAVDCGLVEYLGRDVADLSLDQRILVSIFQAVTSLPKVIIINQSLDYLAEDACSQAVALLKLAISKGSTVILGCLSARPQLKPYAAIIHYRYTNGKITQALN